MSEAVSHLPKAVSSPAGEGSIAEFTWKAVTTGVVLGVVFGAANAYLGLRVGMTVSASIPAAVMTVALFRVLRTRGTILEANMSQTVAAASTALATGTIFTIPALFLWGMVPPYLQVTALCFLGGLFGIAAMIPLRRILIVNAAKELPFPEGKACAEVLRVTTSKTTGSAWIFWGIAIAAATKLALSLFHLMPAEVGFSLPLLPKAHVALELAPALLAIGFILGYRQSAVIVAGAALSSLVLTPMIAHFGAQALTPLAPAAGKTIAQMSAGEIWSDYVRYIGAGAVAVAGILTVGGNLPTMSGAFLAVVRGLRRRGAKQEQIQRTDRDLPATAVLGLVLFVVLVAAVVPGIFSGQLPMLARLVCAGGVAIFGLMFVAVAARIVGLVGVSSQPTSGITLITIMLVASFFALSGWVDPGAKAAVLTVGCLVAIAASKAGDISQDLKTGYLVGATPARQQLGQLIGAAFACWGVAATVLLLGKAYAFGSRELPAPQAMLMKTVIEGVLSGELPWELILTGGGLTLAAVLCGVAGLPFAIGVYLPLSAMAPIFVGGCVRRLASRGRNADSDESSPGTLAASGLVAGEGLAGVLVAGLVAGGMVKSSAGGPLLGGALGATAAVALTAAVCLFLWLAARSRGQEGEP